MINDSLKKRGLLLLNTADPLRGIRKMRVKVFKSRWVAAFACSANFLSCVIR